MLTQKYAPFICEWYNTYNYVSSIIGYCCSGCCCNCCGCCCGGCCDMQKQFDFVVLSIVIIQKKLKE